MSPDHRPVPQRVLVPLPPPDPAANEFAFRLYDRLRQSGGNLCFAPSSIRTALDLACAGARGETARQMRAVVDGAKPKPAPDPGEFLLRNLADDSGPLVTVANALWTQQGAPLLPAFLEEIARNGQAEFFPVDFAHDPAGARRQIAAWSAERTQGLIRDPLPPGALGALVRMVLANAVCFKGRWAAPFDVEETTPRPFRTEAGAEVLVPMMHRCTETGYAHADGVQIVHLAYGGGEWGMLVILPDEDDGLRAVESRLSASWLKRLRDRMEPCEVSLDLPRLRIRGKVMDLGAPLMELGMTAPFDAGLADFSGINGRTPPDPSALVLSAIHQSTMLDLDEAGTAAAAFTGIVATFGSSPRREPEIVSMRADHPFLFAIRSRRTDTLLFLGRVADPGEGADPA